MRLIVIKALMAFFLVCLFNYLLGQVYGRAIILTSFIVMTLAFFFLNEKAWLTTYIIFLFLLLCFREDTYGSFSDGSYIGQWKSLLFKNKTVFANVFGNIVLFIPLGYVWAKRSITYSFIYLMGLILILEGFQFITKCGVFDLLDIYLNILGGLLGIIISVLRGGFYGRKEGKRKRKR